jgi:DNA-binding FadR family transcriptional regulator
MFGVSTVTIRESLSDLRRHELIETRRGRGGGSFVRSPGGSATALVRERLLALTMVEVRDLGDHYAAIAGAAAALAAQRAAAPDLDRLRRAACLIAREQDAGARRRADALFHIEVAVAAQSPRLYKEEVALQAEFGALMWLTMDDDAHAALVRHCDELVAAVAVGDAELAVALAARHVRDSTARIIEYRLGQEQ